MSYFIYNENGCKILCMPVKGHKTVYQMIGWYEGKVLDKEDLIELIQCLNHELEYYPEG